MKNVVLLFVFLSLLSCSTQKVINNSLIINKWRVSGTIASKKSFLSILQNNNKYNYHFFNNGNVNLFHTDISIIEKYKNSQANCLNDYLQIINSLPKISLYGKWQISENQILKIEYNFKGKIFTKKMKIDFVSKAYLEVELLDPKIETN